MTESEPKNFFNTLLGFITSREDTPEEKRSALL
jgi:hypothetical protein